jgi:restriction system protein
VLLRSPWWISLGIALLFVAASQALLPQEYRLLGAMGGIPFAGIASVALWRQLRRPSVGQVEAIAQAAARMNWPDFRAALEQAFARAGYAVTRGDQGADLVLTRDGRTTLVAAQRWKAARQGEEGLRALHAAAQARGASGCIYVTLGNFSANAERFAKSHHIELMQGEALARLIRDVKNLSLRA